MVDLITGIKTYKMLIIADLPQVWLSYCDTLNKYLLEIVNFQVKGHPVGHGHHRLFSGKPIKKIGHSRKKTEIFHDEEMLKRP